MTEPISDFIRHVRVVQYINIASVAVLLNTGNLLFFVARYPAFIDTSFMLVYLHHSNLSLNLCNKFFSVSMHMFGGGIIIAGAIMSLRTYALWGGSRYIFFTLFSLKLVGLVCFIIAYNRIASGSTNVSGEFIIFAVFLSLQCVTVLLTLWKGVKQWREDVRPGPLLTIFYRDGMMYFLGFFALMMAITMIILKGSAIRNYYELLIVLPRVFHSVLSSRMILNLRSVVAEGGVNDHWQVPMDTMDFASNAVETSDPGEMRDSRNTLEMEGSQACARTDYGPTEEMEGSQLEISLSSSSKASPSALSLYPANPLYHVEHDRTHQQRANSPEALQHHIDNDAEEPSCSEEYPITALYCNSIVAWYP
ncbi:hypothetical protein DFH11DRAFT_1300586 [Phellopilus nigrolimitatus]|nr:hypothetical protein DFH11DRAFT_1300586 [Phellopilus nigrolimitatus]